MPTVHDRVAVAVESPERSDSQGSAAALTHHRTGRRDSIPFPQTLVRRIDRRYSSNSGRQVAIFRAELLGGLRMSFQVVKRFSRSRLTCAASNEPLAHGFFHLSRRGLCDFDFLLKLLDRRG